MKSTAHDQSMSFDAATIRVVLLLLLSAPNALAQATNTFPSSGNAGVGTTTPTYKLEVKEDNTSQVNFFVHAATAKTGSSGRAVGIALGDSTNVRSQIALYDNGTFGGSGTDLLLRAAGGIGFTGGNTGAGVTNQLYLNSSGNVGIGTTSPSYKLHVDPSGTSNEIAWFGDGNNRGFRISGNASYADISSIDRGLTAYNGMSFRAQPTSQLYLSTNGTVGIGTTAPNFNLDVNRGATAADVVLGIDSNGSNAYSPMLYFRNTGTAISKIMTAKDLQFQDTNNAPLLYLKTNGNFGIGTTSPSTKLHVVGDVTVTGNIAAKYQDVAEWVPSTEQLPAGTVVVLDSTRSNQVTSSSQAYDTRVAGVISEQPGITLGERGDNKILVATTGRVRVKVDASKGSIHVGDLLVTSDVSGVAMKSEPVSIGGVQIHRPGTLIGKALEPLEKGTGAILVLLSLQ